MASLRKHPRSPFWFAGYTLPDGRLTQRSTGTAGRRPALTIALNYEEAAREASAGRFVESQARKVIADIYARANTEICPKFARLHHPGLFQGVARPQSAGGSTPVRTSATRVSSSSSSTTSRARPARTSVRAVAVVGRQNFGCPPRPDCIAHKRTGNMGQLEYLHK